MRIEEVPKIDLHCHLDGSVRPETVLELSKKYHYELPYSVLEEIESMMHVPETCDSLVTYLKRFDLPQIVMQNEEGLERVTFELLEDASKENVKYIEIRFAPLFHINEGLSIKEVLMSVIRGIERGEEKFDIKANIIVSFLRHMTPESMMDVLKEVERLSHERIVAADLCGAENPGFAQDFINEVAFAKSIGLNITIHAGETGSAQNIVDAIDLLGAQRIGHGVYAYKLPNALEKLKASKTILEMCPKSNLDTKAVNHMSDYPIQEYAKQGIQVTLNTDNRTVSRTSSSNEIQLLENENIVDEKFYEEIYRTSVAAAFASKATKMWLLGQWVPRNHA